MPRRGHQHSAARLQLSSSCRHPLTWPPIHSKTQRLRGGSPGFHLPMISSMSSHRNLESNRTERNSQMRTRTI